MIAKLRAGADQDEVAAELARKPTEDDVLLARLPEGDKRRPRLNKLVRALETRMFDDSEVALDSRAGRHARARRAAPPSA